MYAIIKSGSRQYQVRPESIIEVNRLPLEEGASFETDQVLLVDQDGQDIKIGSPYVSGAKVKGKVLSHLRGRKVIVFKFKRRKNYKRTRGHRQELTKLLIEGIEIGGKAVGAKKPAPAMAKEKAAEKTPPKPVPDKATAKVAEKAATEETPSKKTGDKELAASEKMDQGEAKKAPAKKTDDKGGSKAKATAAKDKGTPGEGDQAKVNKDTAKAKAPAKDEN